MGRAETLGVSIDKLIEEVDRAGPDGAEALGFSAWGMLRQKRGEVFRSFRESTTVVVHRFARRGVLPNDREFFAWRAEHRDIAQVPEER